MTKSTTSSFPSSQNIATRRLANGITLAAWENFTTPAVTLRGSLAVGAMDEPLKKKGLASLTAALLSRGTHYRDYDAINETIESVGASVGAGGYTHTTSIGSRSLAEDFSDMLALVAEMLHHPTFPTQHLERIRTQRITWLKEHQNDTRSVAHDLFYEKAYPSPHPYHYDEDGKLESLQTMTREELVDFHRTTYGPADATFLVAGAIPQQKALDLLEATFGNWQAPAGREKAPSRDLPMVEWPTEAIRISQDMPTKTQSNIFYGLPTIPRQHHDYFALQLANHIMGVFGMMGRIGTSVRDTQGLAYSARSSFSSSRGPAAWVATAGVAPDKVEQAVVSIRHEWERMGRELVSEEELQNSKMQIMGSLPLRLETTRGIAGMIMTMLYHNLGLDYLLTRNDQVAAITREEVRRVSHTYFDAERAILTVAGPKV